MDLQQSLKAVKLYLKLVSVRMVSLQFILKIDFQQNGNPRIWKNTSEYQKQKINLLSLFRLEFIRNQGI